MTRLGAITTLVLLAGLNTSAAADGPSDGVEFFEKRVRPLLAANCYTCHGPDKQRAGLRLDSVAAIRKGGDRGLAIVPGKPEQSLLLRAVGYADDELRMPPKGKLSDAQVADLVAWVKLGAPAPNDHASPVASSPAIEYNLAERSKHWAYQPVRAVVPPSVRNTAWCRSPIDRFILARLEAAGLSPTPPADRRTLIRRVTFDLIGLPPSTAEVDAFLADDSPNAYEKVVDRLLASPHYGERWARHWLDLVRYAETLAFEFDYDLYNAWRYRDYVVRALNADLPYDQFVVEHLAGDLLPLPRRHPADRTNESILATGFFWMGEGKQTPQDIRQEQADRIDNQIDVLGKAFLGQTIACARCHDHKFDAISTRDYYALAGYLKSSRYQQAFLDPPERITTKARELAERKAEIRERAAASWLRQAHQVSRYLLATANSGPGRDTTREPRLLRWSEALRHKDLDNVEHPFYAWAQVGKGTAATGLREQQANAARALGAIDLLEDFGRGTYDGWHVTGDAFGSVPALAGDILVGDSDRPIAGVAAGGAHSGLLSRRLQGELRSRTFTITKRYVHYRVGGKNARLNLVIDGNTLIMNPIYGGLSLPLADEKPTWKTMAVDQWIGHRAYIELSDSTIPMHRLNPPPFTGRVPEGPADGYVVLEEVRFSDDPAPPPAMPHPLNLQALEQARDGTPEALASAYQESIVALIQQWRSNKAPFSRDGAVLLDWLVQNGLLECDEATGDLAAQYRAIEATIPAPARAPALADGTGEDEHVFLRGNYKALGELARRGLPEVLGGPASTTANGSGRLELARRLVDPSNPLLARVLVNRLWLHHFGEGLVRTPDDFGRMGQPPTHPELLDYLASEFVRRGWSLKAIHRILLLTSTYRQASGPEDAGAEVDPDNRLLHRMPVRRLEAEAVRDAILAVAGRLDRSMYGPSVLPYLTTHMEGRGRPNPGPLDGDGRRSLYLNARRNFLAPLLLAFDYPVSFSTIGRRGTSTVPAQALTLMNDPFVVQQAQRWAERMLADPGQRPARRIDTMYREAFSRSPSEAELGQALRFLEYQANRYGAGRDDPRVWADLGHVLINVKEFIFIR